MILPVRKLVFGIALLIAFGSLANGECPDIQKLRKFYQERQFITLNFLQLTHSDIFESVDSLSGSLWAGREGRFRLTMPQQMIISNGILYWSYSIENQQVLVDSVARLGNWNPLTLLYDPGGVYECRNQEKVGDTLEFDMVALDTMTIPYQFDMQILSPGYVPRKIIYFDDNDSRIEVFINGFSRPAELPDSLFNIGTLPGVEIIEMP